MTQIKICGLLPGDDVSFAAHPRVANVGFVFVEASRRFVRPEAARELIAQLDPSTEPVGVFVNATPQQVHEVAERSGIRIAQLHGAESPQDCNDVRKFGIKVWKALAVPREAPRPAEIAGCISSYAPFVDGILLDAAAPKQAGVVTGGHGMTWDWSELQYIAERVPPDRRPPLWVAGGITPANVAELLQTFQPYGIDVSSGVEAAGRKSLEKIQALIEAVSSI